MDYKYIEQLLERYWQCETSLEEEHILRAFFCQADVPAELEQYRSLFAYESDQQQAETPLGADFDERMIAMAEATVPVKAQRVTLLETMRPLLRAAAMVIFVATVATLAQLPFAEDGIFGRKNFSASDDQMHAADVVAEEIMREFGLTPSDAHGATTAEYANAGDTVDTHKDYFSMQQ